MMQMSFLGNAMFCRVVRLFALLLLLGGCSVTLVPPEAPAPVSGVAPGDWFDEAAAWSALRAAGVEPGRVLCIERSNQPGQLVFCSVWGFDQMYIYDLYPDAHGDGAVIEQRNRVELQPPTPEAGA